MNYSRALNLMLVSFLLLYSRKSSLCVCGGGGGHKPKTISFIIYISWVIVYRYIEITKKKRECVNKWETLRNKSKETAKAIIQVSNEWF